MQKASDTRRKLLVVCGPTATGKTRLAVSLAERFAGELVNADSRQVYTGLDIVTGKDIADITVPVWLYDVVSVGEEFSVSQYRLLAMPAIEDIYRRGKLPILVGGSGLYINAVVRPPETIHIPPDPGKRKEREKATATELQRLLAAIDPARLDRMNPSDRANPRRLIRALEIADWETRRDTPPHTDEQPAFDVLWVGLSPDMDALPGRIAERVSERWEAGALSEVKRYPSAVATGVVPILEFLDGKRTEDAAKAAWVKEEVSYAKRQMTWFRKNAAIRWYDSGAAGLAEKVERDVAAWYTRKG